MTFATAEEHFKTLDRTIPDEDDYDLARRFAPTILFDQREPFFPSVVGYTVFRESAESASFPRRIALEGDATVAIEYAVWWDWDIQHLYELEHIWVYLNDATDVVRVDASWHGGWNQMQRDDGSIPMVDGKVALHSESGKHAFAATLQPLLDRRSTTDKSTGLHSGTGGVWVTPLFEGIIQDRTIPNNRVVRTYLMRHQFEPTYEFTQQFALDQATFVPWDALFQWIPSRVNWWVNHLQATIPYNDRHIMRIAHRGASAYAQEGSTSSIYKAVELGSDTIEIDIRFTADNVPVVFHDSTLKRVYGVDGTVGDMDIQTLKSITPDGQEPILTFDEMVKLCREVGVGLYLDIKEINPSGMETVFEIVEKYGMFRHSVFASFRPDFVAEIKAHRPDAITSVLFSSVHVQPVEIGQAVHADYVHPCYERYDRPQDYIRGDWIQAVRDAGFGVICWHEERPDVIADLYEIGVDGICSDTPELLTEQSLKQTQKRT